MFYSTTETKPILFQTGPVCGLCEVCGCTIIFTSLVDYQVFLCLLAARYLRKFSQENLFSKV